MANIDEVVVPINSCLEGLSVKVRISGLRIFRFRLWIAIQLIKFTSFVTHLNFDVDITNGGK